jgi:hypothetical protein
MQIQLIRPPMGGRSGVVRWTPDEQSAIEAVADAIVPGGHGFPAPSEVQIADFVARYTTPGSQPPRWYPYLNHDNLVAHLGHLLTGALEAGAVTAAVERWERDEPDFFALVRDLVYFGYYSRPAVTQAINDRIAAGRDYRNTPQPYGYDVAEDWDEGLLARVRGRYLATADVTRLDFLPDYSTGEDR